MWQLEYLKSYDILSLSEMGPRKFSIVSPGDIRIMHYNGLNSQIRFFKKH